MWGVLRVTLDVRGRGIKRERRVSIEIIAWPVGRDPGPGISGAPVSRVCCRVIDPGNPGRTAAPFVGLSFPGFPAWLIGPGHGVRLPESFAGERVECIH